MDILKVAKFLTILVGVFMIIAGLYGIAKAEEAASEFKEGKCFEYKLDSENGFLLFNTSDQMTKEKGEAARSKKDVEKVCNDLGKAVYGRLMKIPDVSFVTITPRQGGVGKYSYPKQHSWEGFLLPIVLKELETVLCKK